MLRVLPMILTCLVIAGCVTTRATLLDPATRYASVDSSMVRIFTSEEELEGYNFVRVAIINSSGNTTWTSRTKMIESMRKKAGEMGANAILMPDIDEPSAGAKIAGAVFGTGANRQGEVIAIRITGEKQSTDEGGK